MMASASASAPQPYDMIVSRPAVEKNTPLLVLGVLCSEGRRGWRERLRRYYSAFSDRVVVRFILDEKWMSSHKTKTASDEVGVPTGRGLNQHCAHKMVGWWSTAQRWPGSYYMKTDDDAMVDLARILPLLESLPRTRMYGGILRYSSINETSLEGVCWAPGAAGALNKRRNHCKLTRGPIVFAEGPFVLMSADVQAWVAPRLRVDARQLCHFEDLLLGRELASYSGALRLTNLDLLLAEPNVWENRGRWMGVKGPLAHWTRDDVAFDRVANEFRRAAVLAPIAAHPPLQCAPWITTFARLREFPAASHAWELCQSAAAETEWKRLRRMYAMSVNRTGAWAEDAARAAAAARAKEAKLRAKRLRQKNAQRHRTTTHAL